MNDIQLLWFFSSTMQKGPGVKPHTHDYFHLFCILDGSLTFTLDNETFILNKGDIVLVPKGAVHSFFNEHEAPTTYYEAKFTILGQRLNQILADTTKWVVRDEFAFGLVNHIANEYLYNTRILKDSSALSALQTLIFSLTTEARSVADDTNFFIDVTGYTQLSKKTIAFLTEHYSEDLTLDMISNGVGITKNYLCNAFKRDTSMTIVDCLNMIRIRKAAELIVYSDLPLAQVAHLCGYVSTSHFNRVFLRYVGLPPGQCRRAYPYDLMLRADKLQRNTNDFMYSVLAGKSISSNAISEFERNKYEKNQADD